MDRTAHVIMPDGTIHAEPIDPDKFTREDAVKLMHKHGQNVTEYAEHVRILHKPVIAFDHEKARSLIGSMYVDEMGHVRKSGPLPTNEAASAYYRNIARYNGYPDCDPIAGVAVLMPRGWKEQ